MDEHLLHAPKTRSGDLSVFLHDFFLRLSLIIVSMFSFKSLKSSICVKSVQIIF